MARLKKMGTRSGDIIMLDPEIIEEKPGYNVRDMESEPTQAYIRQMADSIHASGTAVFPEITVRQENGNVYVVRGHCRRRAFILARQEGADVKGIRVIADTLKGDAEHCLDLLNSNDGLPLTPMEKAKVVKRLVSFEWTVQEIAKRRGCSPGTISNMLALLNAPADVAELVESGKVSATLAISTVRKEGELYAGDALQKAVDAAVSKGKTRATAKHLPKTPKQVQQETNSKKTWNIWGPRLKSAIETILEAPGVSAQQAAIDQAANLLEEMEA
jgi:ParB/RepB/Spo0J family partition protein